METLRRAQNDINTKLHAYDEAYLHDFYSLVGLEPNKMSYEMGWHVDNKLELHFSSVIADKGPYQGKPILVVDYPTIPLRA
jgi:pantothenate kinase-related protein Tda10